MYLVIGADGFIGQYLIRFFTARGQAVHGTYFSNHTQPRRSPLTYYDVTKSPLTLWRRLPAIKTVFICVQRGSLDDCRRSPKQTAAVNVNGVIRLLDQLRRCGAAPIFLSSNLVFAGTRQRYTERSRPNPTTEYGRQKTSVERYLIRNFRSFAIVRLTKVYDARYPNSYLVRQWLDNLRSGRPVRAVSDILISPIWVADVIRALPHLDPYRQPGIYHLGGPDSGSPADYARRLCRHIQADEKLVRPQPSRAFNWPEKRPRFNLLDASYTKQKIGWQPQTMETALDYELAIGLSPRH